MQARRVVRVRKEERKRKKRGKSERASDLKMSATAGRRAR